MSEPLSGRAERGQARRRAETENSMMQYNTFFIPINDGGEAQASLNTFLRSHRVLQVEKTVFATGWGFCVEWIAGDAPVHSGARGKIDYMKELPPDVFARFSELRKRRKAIAAVERARDFARRHEWFLKCDIRKYFDSIPHEGLMRMLRRKFKDERILKWFERIIATYETKSGRGLPIGNLTSQHLANLYLDPLDRFQSVKYIRYMDDFVFYSDSKAVLKSILDALPSFLGFLGLPLKAGAYINRTARGMDFLGMRVWPGRIGASRASLRRYRRKVAMCERMYEEGFIDEGILQRRVTALTAFLAQGDTLAWRRRFWGNRRNESGSSRVKRGGSWNNDASNCTSSNRNNNNPSSDNNNGFRLCCSAAPQERHTAVPACFPFVGRGRKSQASGLDKNQGCPALVSVPKLLDGRIIL